MANLGYSRAMAATHRDPVAAMTLDEAVAELHGSTPHLRGLLEMFFDYNRAPYPAGGCARLGVPELRPYPR